MDEGVAARCPAEAAVGPAVADHDDLPALAPLLDLDAAGVPDGDLAAAVLRLGDGALERAVFERVVLGLHGEPVHVGLERRALGDGPGHQHPGVLEAEVPVQAGGVVLLDHEHRRARLERLLRVVGGVGPRVCRRDRLGGLLGVALGAVDLEAIPGLQGGCTARLQGEPERSDRILAGLSPLEDLVHPEMTELGVLDLLPGPGGGDGGLEPSAQRVGADGGLVAVVLRPVHEHLAAAQRLLHVADDMVGVVLLERPCELVGDGRDLVGRAVPVERGVEVDALGA